MKQAIIFFFLLINSTFAFAGGHISEADKKEAIKCLGHYTAITFIDADKIEAIKLEYANASFKTVRAYLVSEKVKKKKLIKGQLKN